MYSQMDQDQATTISSSTVEAQNIQYRQQDRRSRVYSTYIPNHRFSRYNNTLIGLLPIRLKESHNELTVQNSGLFSFLTFHWILTYLKESFTNKVGVQIPVCPKVDSCRVNSARLDGLFNAQAVKQGQNNLSVLGVVWQFVRTRMIFACILYVLASLISMLGLVLLAPKILSSEDIFKSIQYVFALICTEFLSCLLHSSSIAISLRTAIRLRSACFASLYRQAMLTALTYDISSWQLVSFLLAEGQHVHNLVMAIPDLVCTPIILICCMLFAGLHLQLWGYLSVLIIIGFFPFFIIIALLSKSLLYKANCFSDQRVKILQEFIINNIHVKFFNLEKWFKSSISDVREKEVYNMKRAGLYDNFCFSFILLQPFLSLAALFIAYSNINIPTFAAICIILLTHLKQSLDNFWFGLNNFIKGVAALNKFKKLMACDTIYLQHKKPKDKNFAIFIEDASFQWIKHQTLNINNSSANILFKNEDELVGFPKNRSATNILHDINMQLENSKLIGICGLPGSGRSSLLLAIMGLLIKSKGKQRTIGNFAYISQEPIIFNDTLKNNILFGTALDSQRYYRVMLFCELQDFISQLPEEDETIIESKLLTLEQKQRIILARALYADGDIYLLDEPLNALEYSKSMRIFDNCVKKSLKDKIILIVTDEIKFLEQCDEIYMLENGKILYHGHHNFLMENENNYAEFIEYLRKQRTVCKDKSNLFEITKDISSAHARNVQNSNYTNYNMLGSTDSINLHDDVDNNFIKFKDSKEESHALRTVLGSYFYHFGNCCSLTFLFLSQVLNAILISCLPVYFIYSLKSSNDNNIIYLSIYLGLFFCMLFFGIFMNLYFNKKTFSASILFHNEILKKLYRASLSFFQSKSLGILTTISVQLQLTDNEIPYLIQNICLNFFVAIMISCVIFYASPWYIIFIVCITAIMIFITAFTRRALISFNRFGMNYIDVLYTEVLSMLTARSLIQAYKKVEYFSKRLYDTYDEYMVHLYIIYAAKSWYNLIINCCTVVLIGCIGFGISLLEPTCSIAENSLFSQNENEQNLPCKALAIVCILQLCYVLHKTFVLYLNLGLTFDVLAQIQKFKMSITDESPNDDDYDDDEEIYRILDEKAHSIKFLNVTLHIEVPVLNSLSFGLQENEKMGFLGLTSAERKAIIAILYKLSTVSSGNVLIGGKRISQIPLKNLRSVVSVIPSEPILFNTTIRKFLTVKNDFPESLIQILQKFHLLDRINTLRNKIDANADQLLNTEEKQILCLAQAYIKQSSIIIIEDFVNDSTLGYILSRVKDNFPQSTMLIFGNDVTGLQGCDTITVIKSGKVINCGNSEIIMALLSQIPETTL